MNSNGHNESIRLLQVVENLNTGAVENWLCRMFSAATVSHPHYDWTFFCTLGKPGRLDETVRGLGGQIIYSPYAIGEKRAFFSNLRKVIKKGRFDILHCHHDFVSAVYLCASLGTTIRKRIVHVHNTDEGILTASALKQFLFKEPMRQACIRLADNVVGISNEALNKFIRGVVRNGGRDQVVYYGVDSSPFREIICTREEFRLSLGLPLDAKLLLFTGRMATLKNPLFVVEVLEQLIQSGGQVAAVFAGAGPLESEVREFAKQKHLGERVRVLGWRDDTATIMRLSDVLVFPRLEEPKEGLGLVLVEAQAAGLPIIASQSITKDVQVASELFTIVPLAAGPHAWAEATAEILLRPKPSQADLLSRIESSAFGLAQGVASLMTLYNGR